MFNISDSDMLILAIYGLAAVIGMCIYLILIIWRARQHKEKKIEDRFLILVRGLPGSGKRTLADIIHTLKPEDTFAVAADVWFDLFNKGIFDASRLFAAHSWCLYRTKQSMEKRIGVIVVHNTFTTESELSPYMAAAKDNHYKVITLISENRHGSKSIHNVPEQTIKKMQDRFDIKL